MPEIINKMTKTIFLIFLSFFILSNAQAELINGPANIREKPGGKLVAFLNDGVEVELVPPYISAKSWLSLDFVVYVEKEAYLKRPPQKKPELKGNCLLYDKQGRNIGRTIETFKIGWDIGEENGRLGIVVEDVVTHKRNVREDTIPEYDLENILLNTETPILKDQLADYLNKYNFEKWPLVKEKDLEDYYIYESGLYDPSPMPRLELIFYKDRLVLVIHRNLLSSSRYKSRELFREMKTMYLEKLDTKTSEKIQKEIIEPLRTAD
jgi:hypothetical protein